MKKISFLIVALIMSVGMVMAQGPRKGRDKQPDPKVRAEKMTERMANEYSLNESQQGKLLELNLTMAEKMKPAPGQRHHHKNKEGNKKREGDKAPDVKQKKDSRERPEMSKEAREQHMAKIKEERQAYDAKLKEIFTADQYKKYEANQAERQQKMKDQRAKREKKSEA